jgi:hypothetical protein
LEVKSVPVNSETDEGDDEDAFDEVVDENAEGPFI